MSTQVDKILEWEATDGEKQALLLVEDESLPVNSVNRTVIEVSTYDSNKKKWVTENTVSHVKELTSFGIPETLVD